MALYISMLSLQKSHVRLTTCVRGPHQAHRFASGVTETMLSAFCAHGGEMQMVLVLKLDAASCPRADLKVPRPGGRPGQGQKAG